ncbi:MAG TPA: HAMP domain-containing sensor histidine kinase [Angustibacter sp.]|nr:HAMP domain-containing sensor histidine kinase [Angustibacter sp.]
MRRQIWLLVAATTSAVILAFLIPLGLLVRTLAEDRALASASQEAQSVAALVAAVSDQRQLADLVGGVGERSRLETSVVLADGTQIGPALATPDDELLERARTGEAFTSRRPDGSARVYVPVVTEAGTAVVRSVVPGRELHRGLTAAWATIAALGLLLLAGSLLAADRLGRRVAAPISEVSLVAHRLREGEMTARAHVGGPPEVADLASSLNRLADRIGELLRIEREAVADLSHRLRTPITALRLDVDAVQPPEVAERLGAHVEHLQRTVDAIVKEARRPVLSSLDRGCDAAAVVRERVDFWSALAADQGRSVTVEVPQRPMPAALDASELADVLDVLLDNVFAHTPEGTGFEVALSYDSAGAVRLEVIDAGPGLTDPSLTERGVSGAGSTGLGLDIVRRTAQAAGGELVVRRGLRGGTVAIVTFAPGRP